MIKLLLLYSLPLAAQTYGVVCPAVSVKPVVCSITSSTPNATTFQWSLTTNVPNSGMIVKSLIPTKSAASNGTKMLMVGMNVNTIPVGPVATVAISFPLSFTCPGNSPCLTVTISDAAATVANHSKALISSPASARVRVR